MNASDTFAPARDPVTHWLRRSARMTFLALSFACIVACIAALTFSVILHSSGLRPPGTVAEVARWNRYGTFVMLSLIPTGGVLMAGIYLAARARPDAPAPTEGRWSRVIVVLAGAALIWMVITTPSVPPAVSNVDGAWRTSPGSGWRVLSENEAREILWQNIRFSAGVATIGLLFVAKLTQVLGDAARGLATSAARSEARTGPRPEASDRTPGTSSPAPAAAYHPGDDARRPIQG